jgi:hypothetical protein
LVAGGRFPYALADPKTQNGSTLIVFGGYIPDAENNTAAADNDFLTLPLGPPAPQPPPTITNVTADAFTASWVDPVFEQATKGYRLCYRAEDEERWTSVEIPQNGPRYEHRLENLRGNLGYEVKINAVGDYGDSSWWGGDEIRDVWTLGSC